MQKRYISDILDEVFKKSIDFAKRKSHLTEADEETLGAKDSSDTAEIDDEKEEEKLKKGDITVDDVIEKLNAIRAGKSYKDQEILQKLTDYVDDLESAEKTALLAFLKALAQIVTGEIATKDVVKPSEKPVDVKMEKEPAVKSRTIKPIVIKKPEKVEGDEQKEKTPAEDTKGPVPIVAKKKG